MKKYSIEASDFGRLFPAERYVAVFNFTSFFANDDYFVLDIFRIFMISKDVNKLISDVQAIRYKRQANATLLAAKA